MDDRKSEVTKKDANIQRAYWGTIILDAVLILVFGYAFTFTVQGEKSFVNMLATASFMIALLITMASLVLTVRQRQELGLKLTFHLLLLMTVIVTSLLQGRALPASILLVIVYGIGIAWIFPHESKRWYSFIAAVVLAVIWAIEWSNPPWRLPQSNMIQAGPLGAIVFGIIFGVFLLRQSREVIARSLQTKVAFWTGLILAGISIILVGYATLTARQTAIKNAEKEALAFAASRANLIRADTEIPLDTARALAQALTAAKAPENTYRNLSRSQVNAMLRQVLIENSSFLGTDTLWEPNAFDGQDAFYRGKLGHDLTGRFIPYWVRSDDGSINLVPLEGYETPGIGDWYILPRLTKQEMVLAPLIYPINGVDTVMASFVVPIIYDSQFYGIVGIDAPIAYVQEIVNSTTQYGKDANMFLVSSNGSIIGYRDQPELTSQNISDIIPDYFTTLQAPIAAGEAFTNISPDGKYLRVFAPVKLGKTESYWTFGMLIPFSEITAAATAEAIRAGSIGVILALVGLILLWFLTGQIVRPIHALTTAANAISQGNLNVTVDVRETDETGVLAKAFNLMISQLREVFSTLEERVAERTRNLELAAEVGRTVSQVRALDVMLTEAAELIRSQFNLYYVQVYLTNPSKTYLNLKAGTGETGSQLLARNHRLPLDTNSINGRAAIEKHSVVISNTQESATFKPNPLLPDTRSEMAVPLILGDNVVGVLDMQSSLAGSLGNDVLPAFEALAGQLAIAIQNANFLAEVQQARAEVESQARKLSRANWVEYLDAIHTPEETGFVFEQNNIKPLTGGESAEKQGALTVPLTVTGETLGSLNVKLEGALPISRIDELLQTVAQQVSQQIEVLRLLESAERFRYEAEQASRRLTHEGWQSYMSANETSSLGYIYDLKEVRPYNPDDAQQEEKLLSLPLKVRNTPIGKLIVQGVESENNEAIEIASVVAERLSAHIEGLRLSMQTEQALTATKKQAQREQALRQITSAVRGSTDPAIILRTAARELGNLIGRQTIIRLAAAEKKSDTPQKDQPVPPAASSNVDGGKA